MVELSHFPSYHVSITLLCEYKKKFDTCARDISASYSHARYNISTDDYDPWNTDAASNEDM